MALFLQGDSDRKQAALGRGEGRGGLVWQEEGRGGGCAWRVCENIGRGKKRVRCVYSSLYCVYHP